MCRSWWGTRGLAHVCTCTHVLTHLDFIGEDAVTVTHGQSSSSPPNMVPFFCGSRAPRYLPPGLEAPRTVLYPWTRCKAGCTSSEGGESHRLNCSPRFKQLCSHYLPCHLGQAESSGNMLCKDKCHTHTHTPGGSLVKSEVFSLRSAGSEAVCKIGLEDGRQLGTAGTMALLK